MMLSTEHRLIQKHEEGWGNFPGGGGDPKAKPGDEKQASESAG
jgi:hypothetical protein